ncbi:MAG: ATP phosphoribosyltransferase regulatory subunit [Pseudomonadales bacterium]|nr:ATP phosphoribosyltransferase regulatory subunit [Pseudomonadales bacterium]
MKTYWRLPRGVDELLPPDAWELEALRRKVLDLFVSWGYDYIEPPVVEYLDALLVGSGEDLDLQTLKAVDQVTGKQLGVRADMTSQAVRIDAHSRVTDDIQRLCYAGNVVFANPQLTESSRVPIKAGAELFGSPSVEADAEVIGLMMAAVQSAGVDNPVLLIGHMGIYRSLVADLVSAGEVFDESELFACIQRKSQADIAALLPESTLAHMLVDLPSLMGDVESIGHARERLAGAGESVVAALDELEQLALLVRAKDGQVSVRIDVSELSGYGYHNGPVFAVYHPEHGRALAQGGRYDGVGEAFGRARPATGFDMDLKSLLSKIEQSQDIIFAPSVRPTLADESSEQLAKVAELRAAGERVRVALTDEEEIPKDCRRLLVVVDGSWQVIDRTENT